MRAGLKREDKILREKRETYRQLTLTYPSRPREYSEEEKSFQLSQVVGCRQRNGAEEEQDNKWFAYSLAHSIDTMVVY